MYIPLNRNKVEKQDSNHSYHAGVKAKSCILADQVICGFKSGLETGY